MYGLEIARAIVHDPDFLEAAQNIRSMLVEGDGDKPTRRSRYNTRKIVNRCEMCGYRPVRGTDQPLDVHHIRPRSEAGAGARFRDGERLNALSNLASLCKECHDKVHKNGTDLKYVHTTRGTQLVLPNN
jgi:hypothetical protein